MPQNDLWTQIPTSLLDTSSALAQAEEWASQQKAKIADAWAQTQKNAIATMQSEWQKQAGQIAGDSMDQDALLKTADDASNAPLPIGKVTPLDSTSSPNPADILSGTPPSTFDNQPHLQDGTPENAFISSMRQGAASAGTYIKPPDKSPANPDLESELQLLANKAGQTIQSGLQQVGGGPTPVQTRPSPLTAPLGMMAGVGRDVTQAGVNLVNQGIAEQAHLSNPNLPPEERQAAQREAMQGFILGSIGVPEGELAGPVTRAARTAAEGTTPILGGVFYSKAEDLANRLLPAKATGSQILSTLINNGAKPAELAWTGLKDFLQGRAGEAIPKTEVQQFIRDNLVQVQEVVKPTPSNIENIQTKYGRLVQDLQTRYAGSPDWEEAATPQERVQLNSLREQMDNSDTSYNNPRYSGTTLPGGQNYRELLLTMPPKVPEPLPPQPWEGPQTVQLGSKYAVFNRPLREEQQWTLSTGDKIYTITSTPFGTYDLRGPDIGGEYPSAEAAQQGYIDRVQAVQTAQIPTFQSGHWDEPNILAHIRFDERVDPQGKPVLFLQEVQSDWAQQGRKYGFGPKTLSVKDFSVEPTTYNGEPSFKVVPPNNFEDNFFSRGMGIYRTEEEARNAIELRVRNYSPFTPTIPNMPFQRTEDWVKLAAKRMVAWAADNGFGSIGWTTGAQQDRIEGLGDRFSSLEYDRRTGMLTGVEKRTGDAIKYRVTENGLPDYIGQELTDRLFASPADSQNNVMRLTAEQLNTTTKGMAEFYDKILPSVFRDLGKQFGAKVEDIPVDVAPKRDLNSPYLEAHPDGLVDVIINNGAQRESYDTYQEAADRVQEILKSQTKPEIIHSLVIPSKMAQVAKAGQTLFSPPAVGGAVAGAVYGSTQGNTPEERAQNALKYGLGGALAGHFVSGGELPFGLAIKPVHTSPDLQRLADMLHADAPTAQFMNKKPLLERITDNWIRAWTDNGVDLSRLQQAVAEHRGTPLTAEEMIAELRRLNPTPAAELDLRKNLSPALQQVGPQDLTRLQEYLIMRHNMEVANAMGEKEFDRIVAQPLKGLPAKAQLATLQARLRMYNRFLQQGIAAQDGTIIMHYQPLVDKTQKLVQNAQNRLNQQIVHGKLSQAAAAQQASQQIAQARSFSAGMGLDKSIQGLIDLEQEVGPQRWASIEDAGEKVVAFGKTLLQRRVNSGLITQDLADYLQKLYPEYVPTHILDYAIDPANIPAGRRSLSVSDNGLRKLTQEGPVPEMQQEGPLAAIVRNTYSVHSLGLKNEVFNGLHQLYQSDPAYFQDIMTPVKAGTKDTTLLKTVQGFVNGEHTYYQMPRDLALAIENTPKTYFPALQAVMNVMRSVLASANPLFIPTHAIITAIPYMIRTTTREGGPQALPRVVGALAGGYWDSLILPALKGDILKGRYEPGVENYLSQGGGVFSHAGNYFSPEGAKASVEDLARSNALEIRGIGDFKRIGLDAIQGKPFSEIINRIDLAPRVAAARLATARGANRVQAITEGRTASIDFAQGGDWAKAINQFVPFFNVAMQGSALTVRAYRDNPKAFIATALTLLVAPTAGAEAWNRSDPQRSRDYDDVPNYYKDNGIIIMAPDSASIDAQGNRKPNFVYIPTRSFSPFVIATRELMGRALGADPRSWQSLLYGDNLLSPSGGALGSFSPVADVTRLIPGGPIASEGIAALTGVNVQTGGRVESQAANQRSGVVAKGIAGGIRGAQTALGGMPTAQSSDVQYGLQEAGAPGRILGSIGEQNANLNPIVKNSTGQTLRNAQNARLSPELRQLLLDAGEPEVTPAAKVVSKLPLTQMEEAELQRNLNTAFQQVAERVMADSRYQRADQAAKTEYVKSVLARVRKTVGENFLQTLAQRDGVDTIRQRIKDALALPKAS